MKYETHLLFEPRCGMRFGLWRSALFFCALLFFMALSPQALAKKEPRDNLDSLAIEVAATTQPWAAPMDGGAIRALFIAPRYTMRDVSELGGRIEMEYGTVALWDASRLGFEDDGIPGVDEASTIRKLQRQIGRDWDVIVLGNFQLALLPKEARSELNAKVKKGAGLLLVNERGDIPPEFSEILNSLEFDESSRAITRGIGQELTPEWPINLDFVKAGTWGKGRVVHIAYPGERPSTSFLLPALTDPIHARDCYQDTYYSLVAKALRWAGGRSPSVEISEITDVTIKGPDENEIPPELPEEHIQQIKDGVARPLYRSFRVTLSSPADQQYQVSAQVREPSRGITLMYPDLPPLAKRAREYLLELPIGPGTYLLDVRLATKKNKVAEWYSEVVRLSGWPEISDLTFSKGFLLPNDTLDISLGIRAQYHAPRPCVVYARATDSLGRTVSEAGMPVVAEGGPVKLTMRFADLLANLVKVEVFAADTTNKRPSRWELDHAVYGTPVYLPVKAPRPAATPGFAAVSPAPVEYNIRSYYKSLKKLNVDTLIVPPTDESRFYLATENLRPVPELITNAPEKIEGKIRRPCISQLSTDSNLAKKLREDATGFSIVGASQFNLGVGASLAATHEEVCRCADCLAGFGAWLARRYTNILELNRAWGSNFTSFDEVMPAGRDDVLESRNYPQWLEFRIYMDSVFAGAMAYGSETVQNADRYGKAGFTALNGSRASLGYDWWLLASQLDAPAVPADPVVVEMIRSFRRAGSTPSLTFGGGHDFTEAYAKWLPWYRVLHGFTGLVCASPFGTADMKPYLPALRPDGRPGNVIAQIADAERGVKDGVGTLLLNAQRVKPVIAVYASQSSLYLNQIDLAFQCDSRRAEECLIRMLEQLGYQYDFVSYEQVKQGKLKQYKALVMPMLRSLDDDELREVRLFAENGGCLIADIAPGEFDGHGRRRAAMPMDDDFGVSHAGAPQPIAAGQATPTGGGDVACAGVVVDAAAREHGGKAEGAMGDAQVWIRGGRSLLLNHTWPPYASETGLYAAASSQVGDVLQAAGIPKEWSPVAECDGGFAGEVVHMQYGAAELIAFLANPVDAPDTQKVKLKFKDAFRVYGTGKAGESAQKGNVDLKVGRGRFALLSALPYEVEGINITCPEQVRAGNRLPVRIVIKAGKARPGDHLVHIALLKNGVSIPHYEMDAVCTDGETATFIPLALDDAMGEYEVRVKDLLSNACKTAHVKVIEPAASL